MKKIRTRPKPDVAGKPVDLIEVSKLAFMIAFDVAQLSSPDDIEMAVLKALHQLSASADKRTRSRDFAVLVGTMRNRLGLDLLSVCLPERISAKVVGYFSAALNSFDRVDTGTYPTMDFSLRALARYSDGKIIVYTGASSPAGLLPSKLETIKTWNCAWETRGAELLAPASSVSPRYNRIPESLTPPQPVVGGHSLEDHERISKVLDSLLLPVPRSMEEAFSRAPFGYQHLRSFCTSHLGISVHEDDLPGNCSAVLRVGRPYATASGLSARVMIRVNSSLPPATKYVALAHELAHYRLHFPWLLASSAAFDLALQFPEVIVVLQNFFLKKESKLRKFEEQADFYSSYFLLSPFADQLDQIVSHMMMDGRQPKPEELAWIWLLPFFPNEDVTLGTWEEYRARSKRAGDVLLELSSGIEPGSLLERYFGALVRRLRREYSLVFDKDMLKDVVELMILFAVGKARERRDRLRQIIETSVQTEGWQKPASIEEFMKSASGLAQAQLGLAGEVSLEVVLPQDRAAEDFVCPLVVLVPLRADAEQAQPELVPLPGMSDVLAASRERWIQRMPECGLVIAQVSEKVRASLAEDAEDVGHLLILPTSWNLEMQLDGEWYGAGVYEASNFIAMNEPRIVGTLDEWAGYCAAHRLRLHIEKLSESQVNDLRRINLVDPSMSARIHQLARNSLEVEHMIKNAKSAFSLETLPWERPDYFEKDRQEYLDYIGHGSEGMTGADRYAERIIQDCMFGGLFDSGFWPAMFQSDDILKAHGISPGVREEALERIRDYLIDHEVCGDFDRWFECQNCGRSFLPELEKEYVAATVRTRKILCGNCCEQCVEQNASDDE